MNYFVINEIIENCKKYLKISSFLFFQYSLIVSQRFFCLSLVQFVPVIFSFVPGNPSSYKTFAQKISISIFLLLYRSCFYWLLEFRWWLSSFHKDIWGLVWLVYFHLSVNIPKKIATLFFLLFLMCFLCSDKFRFYFLISKT